MVLSQGGAIGPATVAVACQLLALVALHRHACSAHRWYQRYTASGGGASLTQAQRNAAVHHPKGRNLVHGASGLTCQDLTVLLAALAAGAGGAAQGWVAGRGGGQSDMFPRSGAGSQSV